MRQLQGRTPSHFNPRSPYGERLYRTQYLAPFPVFQSTLPIRGATVPSCKNTVAAWISIHAPHTGSDENLIFNRTFVLYFNPRSPYGERHPMSIMTMTIHAFQSTLPIRGATRHAQIGHARIGISIHAPHTGSDGG